MTKLLSSSIIYLQLMMVAAWIITGSRQVSAWIRHRRWNRGSNLRNWHHFGRLKFIWLHDNKKPCSFNRLAVKNEQCDYHDHHHLYNGGDIFLRKHVFLYQNVVWWVSNKPQEIKNVWMNIWLINLLLFIHKKFLERSSTIILGYTVLRNFGISLLKRPTYCRECTWRTCIRTLTCEGYVETLHWRACNATRFSRNNMKD